MADRYDHKQPSGPSKSGRTGTSNALAWGGSKVATGKLRGRKPIRRWPSSRGWGAGSCQLAVITADGPSTAVAGGGPGECRRPAVRWLEADVQRHIGRRGKGLQQGPTPCGALPGTGTQIGSGGPIAAAIATASVAPQGGFGGGEAVLGLPADRIEQPGALAVERNLKRGPGQSLFRDAAEGLPRLPAAPDRREPGGDRSGQHGLSLPRKDCRSRNWVLMKASQPGGMAAGHTAVDAAERSCGKVGRHALRRRPGTAAAQHPSGSS